MRDIDSKNAIFRLTGLQFDTVPDAVYLTYNNLFIARTSIETRSVIFVSKKSKTNAEIEFYYDVIINSLKNNAHNTNVIISASSEQDFKSAERFYDY